MKFEPATPSSFFGYFDILLLAGLLLFDFLFWKYNVVKTQGCTVVIARFIVLLFVFPLISTKVEVASVHRKDEVVDGFNLLYIWFRWPVWWALGLIETLVFKAIIGRKQKPSLDNTAPNTGLVK